MPITPELPTLLPPFDDGKIRDIGDQDESHRAISSALRLLKARVNELLTQQLRRTTPIIGEAFTGDGATMAFTLAHAPVANSTAVFVSGARLAASAFTVAGTTLTFSVAPGGGAAILVDYTH